MKSTFYLTALFALTGIYAGQDFGANTSPSDYGYGGGKYGNHGYPKPPSPPSTLPPPPPPSPPSPPPPSPITYQPFPFPYPNPFLSPPPFLPPPPQYPMGGPPGDVYLHNLNGNTLGSGNWANKNEVKSGQEGILAKILKGAL